MGPHLGMLQYITGDPGIAGAVWHEHETVPDRTDFQFVALSLIHI